MGGREVEPDGHGEVTHGHELYLNELAPIVLQRLYPTRIPLELVTEGSKCAGKNRVDIDINIESTMTTS
jgi:hypothetical protein